MRKLKNKILQYLIRQAKKSKLVQSAFEAPISESSFTKKGSFVDSKGNSHILYNELRNIVKPGASSVAEAMKKEKVYTDDEISKMARNSSLLTDRLLSFTRAFGVNISKSEILEIGCHSGVVSYALADMGATVTGTEFSGYKVESTRMTEVTQTTLNKADESLQILRKRVAGHFKNADNVKFVDDDICNSVLPTGAFDIVVSWDVLEHLAEPANAFENISRILKKGGISVNEYNPFFSLNGGHSLCTLDFFWGHVRLGEKDFLKYLEQERKTEYDQAKSFYLKGLNRMSIEKMKKYAEKAGLKLLACYQFTREQHIRMLTGDILDQCKQNYPEITPVDLTTPKVIVVFQKQ
ncbi:MAG: hypothetical protein A2W91_13530 [Bacteroidetes bacterium GWF2_38_335]|nr:MAG: hypothetical protein A2W91_13530 [Bacteroidetes bacterium GWF2_38_335]OFY77273.1 MAG: hypothetical protein A2281_15195 [Bacteroidetes bacterium RIFOXYA12_FULL_38_20]HBS85723.1 hypothetical protein [Bacteroidales bacterium]